MDVFKKKKIKGSCADTQHALGLLSLLQGLGQVKLLVQVDFGIFGAIFCAKVETGLGKPTKQMKNIT